MENDYDLDDVALPGTEIDEPDAASIDEVLVPVYDVECEMGCMPMDHGERDALVDRVKPSVTATDPMRIRLSFTVDRNGGSDTTSMWLTQGELFDTWYEIGFHLGIIERPEETGESDTS